MEDDARAELRKLFDEDYVQKILHPKDYNAYIEKVKDYVGKTDIKEINSSQLRNIFSRVKYISKKEDLFRLRPQLAYAGGRAEKKAMKKLVFLLDDLIKSVASQEDLKEFKSFFEAVIAYHKYFNSESKD